MCLCVSVSVMSNTINRSSQTELFCPTQTRQQVWSVIASQAGGGHDNRPLDSLGLFLAMGLPEGRMVRLRQLEGA